MNLTGLINCSKTYRRKYLQVLQAVYSSPGISRGELIIRLDLSKNNITETVNGMIDAGLLFEQENINGKAGRSPFGLHIRKDLFYTLGAALTLEEPRLVLLNAAREEVDSRPLLHEGRMQQRFLGELRQKTISLMQQVGAESILGIGIALPGFVDFESGQVYYSQAFVEADINIKEYFREHCGLDSFLINTSHIQAVMEKKFGAAADMDNFITIDDGLGAGMFFNGQLYRGWQMYSGELGHLKVTEDNIPVQDGRTGILQSHALFGLIGQQVIAAARRGRKFRIPDQYLRDWNYIPVPQIVSAIEGGDKFVEQLVGECFSYIGDAVLNLAYLLNPEAIFLPQWTSRVPACTLNVVRYKMSSYGFRNVPIATGIRSSSAGPELMANAAGCLLGEEHLNELSVKRPSHTSKSKKILNKEEITC